MVELKVNEAPVRTSRNFNINNIKLKDITVPDKCKEFKKVKIRLGAALLDLYHGISNLMLSDNSVKILDNSFETNLKYGMNSDLEEQVKNNANINLDFTINSKKNENAYLMYEFDEENSELVDNIKIIANEGTKSKVIIKYSSLDNAKCYHNGVLNIDAKENAELDVIIVNFTNSNTDNFMSIQNEIAKSAKVKFVIVDFGSKNSITNYYSNVIGDEAENYIKTIYLGNNEQLFDLNYIVELKGKKTNVDIEVQGALKDNAKKHFKGSIDFKKGSKKAKGNENEFCMLLSDTAKSIALPMLLCSEEDVEGNHASSAGKIGEKELFYIMSRGFNLKEAMKLMVRAKFNSILENIEDETLKEEILKEMDKKLD